MMSAQRRRQSQRMTRQLVRSSSRRRADGAVPGGEVVDVVLPARGLDTFCKLDGPVERIILPDNLLTHIPALHLSFLWYLDLCDNLLQSISGIAEYKCLGYLALAGNKLSFESIKAIERVSILNLFLFGNPFEIEPNYRKRVCRALPLVWALDGSLVAQHERRPPSQKKHASKQSFIRKRNAAKAIISPKAEYALQQVPLNAPTTPLIDALRVSVLCRDLSHFIPLAPLRQISTLLDDFYCEKWGTNCTSTSDKDGSATATHRLRAPEEKDHSPHSLEDSFFPLDQVLEMASDDQVFTLAFLLVSTFDYSFPQETISALFSHYKILDIGSHNMTALCFCPARIRALVNCAAVASARCRFATAGRKTTTTTATTNTNTATTTSSSLPPPLQGQLKELLACMEMTAKLQLRHSFSPQHATIPAAISSTRKGSSLVVKRKNEADKGYGNILAQALARMVLHVPQLAQALLHQSPQHAFSTENSHIDDDHHATSAADEGFSYLFEDACGSADILSLVLAKCAHVPTDTASLPDHLEHPVVSELLRCIRYDVNPMLPPWKKMDDEASSPTHVQQNGVRFLNERSGDARMTPAPGDTLFRGGSEGRVVSLSHDGAETFLYVVFEDETSSGSDLIRLRDVTRDVSGNWRTFPGKIRNGSASCLDVSLGNTGTASVILTSPRAPHPPADTVQPRSASPLLPLLRRDFDADVPSYPATSSTRRHQAPQAFARSRPASSTSPKVIRIRPSSTKAQSRGNSATTSARHNDRGDSANSLGRKHASMQIGGAHMQPRPESSKSVVASLATAEDRFSNTGSRSSSAKNIRTATRANRVLSANGIGERGETSTHSSNFVDLPVSVDEQGEDEATRRRSSVSVHIPIPTTVTPPVSRPQSSSQQLRRPLERLHGISEEQREQQSNSATSRTSRDIADTNEVRNSKENHAAVTAPDGQESAQQSREEECTFRESGTDSAPRQEPEKERNPKGLFVAIPSTTSLMSMSSGRRTMAGYEHTTPPPYSGTGHGDGSRSADAIDPEIFGEMEGMRALVGNDPAMGYGHLSRGASSVGMLDAFYVTPATSSDSLQQRVDAFMGVNEGIVSQRRRSFESHAGVGTCGNNRRNSGNGSGRASFNGPGVDIDVDVDVDVDVGAEDPTFASEWHITGYSTDPLSRTPPPFPVNASPPPNQAQLLFTPPKEGVHTAANLPNHLYQQRKGAFSPAMASRATGAANKRQHGPFHAGQGLRIGGFPQHVAGEQARPNSSPYPALAPSDARFSVAPLSSSLNAGVAHGNRSKANFRHVGASQEATLASQLQESHTSRTPSPQPFSYAAVAAHQSLSHQSLSQQARQQQPRLSASYDSELHQDLPRPRLSVQSLEGPTISDYGHRSATMVPGDATVTTPAPAVVGDPRDSRSRAKSSPQSSSTGFVRRRRINNYNRSGRSGRSGSSNDENHFGSSRMHPHDTSRATIATTVTVISNSRSGSGLRAGSMRHRRPGGPKPAYSYKYQQQQQREEQLIARRAKEHEAGLLNISGLPAI